MARVPVSGNMRGVLLWKNATACCVCKARNVGLNFHVLLCQPCLSTGPVKPACVH